MASSISRFPVTGPVNVSLRLGHGTINVTATEGLSEAVVRLTPRDPSSDVVDRTTVQMVGNTLSVVGPRQGGLADLVGGWRNRMDIETELEVPSGSPLHVASATEVITVLGRCGDTVIATGGARIHLDWVDGHLQLRCGKSDTEVRTVAGSVKLRGGGGSAHFGSIGGDLDCKFGNGRLSAELVRGQVRSRAGNASATLGAAYGNIDLACGSGPISIGIPVGVAAKIDVFSGAGLVESEIPVQQAPDADATRITVRARTGWGDIHLARAPAA
jgi:hypothetical protein